MAPGLMPPALPRGLLCTLRTCCPSLPLLPGAMPLLGSWECSLQVRFSKQPEGMACLWQVSTLPACFPLHLVSGVHLDVPSSRVTKAGVMAARLRRVPALGSCQQARPGLAVYQD